MAYKLKKIKEKEIELKKLKNMIQHDDLKTVVDLI